jgi:putative transposase
MPRPLRLDAPGAFHHVTARGNRRAPIYADDADRTRFVSFLADAVQRFEWRCHAFCLMSNHFHLVLETPKASLAAGMQWLNGRYAQTFNRRHSQSGHVFQGRYSSNSIDRDAHLLGSCRYAILNPIRAGLCGAPEEWSWSSYRATAGLGRPLRFVTTERLLTWFADSRPEAQARYREFVSAGITGPDVLAAYADFQPVIAAPLHRMPQGTPAPSAPR